MIMELLGDGRIRDIIHRAFFLAGFSSEISSGTPLAPHPRLAFGITVFTGKFFGIWILKTTLAWDTNKSLTADT